MVMVIFMVVNGYGYGYVVMWLCAYIWIYMNIYVYMQRWDIRGCLCVRLTSPGWTSLGL